MMLLLIRNCYKIISKSIRFLLISFMCIFLLNSPFFPYFISDNNIFLNNNNSFSKYSTIFFENTPILKVAFAYNKNSKSSHYGYSKNISHNLLESNSYNNPNNRLFFSPIDVDKNLIYKKLYLSGQNYFNSGNYLRADSCFSRIVDSSYILADYALYYLAQSNQKMGDYSSAIKYYEQYRDKYPEGYWNEKVRLEKVDCLYQLNELYKVEETLRDFLKNYSESELIPEVMFQLSSCLEEQEKWEDAVKNYYQIWLDWPLSEQAGKAKARFMKISETHDIEIKPANLASLHQRARKLMKAYLFDSALSDLLKLKERANLKQETEFVSKVKLDIAICNYRLRKYEEAASILSELLNSDISSALKKNVLFWLAKSNTYLGNTQYAIECYSLLVEKYPYSDLAPESLENIAKIWENKNQTEEAMNTYERIITEYPYSVFAKRTLWNTGWIFYKKGEFSEALKKFDRLVKIGRGSSLYSKSLYWKSKVLEKLGENDSAIQAYKDLLDNNSYDFYKIIAISRLEEIDPDWIEGSVRNSNFEELKKSIEKEIVSEHYKKGRELFILGFYDDAINELTIVEKEEYNNKILMLEISNLFFKTGNYHGTIKIAVNYLNELLSDEPKGEVKSIWKTFYPRGYHDTVEKWANIENVNPFLIYSVIREESHFNPFALSVSDARGLMQIIPPTGKWIAEKTNPRNFDVGKMWDEETNIRMGSWYLRFLLDYFDGVEMLATAGYNAGQGAVGKWANKYDEKEADFFIENIPYEQTREYVKKVLRDYVIYHQIYGKDDLSISSLVNNFTTGD